MNWEDECYLLSKKKFRENANIINVFSESKGKMSGVVYGGNSRKIRNYLQISNKLFIIHNSKNENKIGYFKTELIKPISPIYFNDKEKTSAIISLCSLLNLLLPESQPNQKIYIEFEKLVTSLNEKSWINRYILFELNLIKELGYDTNLSSFKEKEMKDIFESKKLKIDEFLYDVPVCLIQNKIPENSTSLIIKKSLEFTRKVFLNKFFLPNNLIFPKSKIIFKNYFN